MDIDTFFKDGDLSFGMDGANPSFKNFVGTGQNTATKPDDYKFAPSPEYGFANDTSYAQMAGAGVGDDETYSNLTGRQSEPFKWYVNKLTAAEKADCAKLQSVMDAIAKDIANNKVKMATAKAGERRVLEDYNKGLAAAGSKVKEFFDAASCQQKADDALAAQLGNLSKSSRTSQIILYAGLGVATIFLGYVLYKRFKK